MNRKPNDPLRVALLRFAAVTLTLALAPSAFGQDFDLSWYTIDGGGEMFSNGGDFELSGTIGQPDAGVAMTGGSFELIGGFWAGTTPVECTCLGDVNGDSFLNGADVRAFVDCVLNGGACSCAELDGVPGLDNGDVALFVNDLLSGASCP